MELSFFVTIGIAFFFLVLGFFLGKHWEKKSTQLKMEFIEKSNQFLEKNFQDQKKEIEQLQSLFRLEIENNTKHIQEKFENLAHNIFEEKNLKFKRESKESIESILNPLKDNIESFKKDFNDKYLKQNESRIRFETEIKNLTSLSQTLSKEANNLSSALSGSVKAQGNWGEIVLERVLNYSGLKEDVDYIREGKGLKLRNADGDLQKPDVLINLPDNKHLIIDSKVTLTSYTNYIASNELIDKEKYLNDFVQSVKNHINGLSNKNYELIEKLITPEYVLMFMPIEGALSLALEKDNSLFEFAWSKKIILVGPTNLLATLKAVESVWKQEKQEKNALKIAEQGGRLYDKLNGFLDSMLEIEKSLEKAQSSYQDAFKKLSSGKGNILLQAEKMKELGAKAKKSIDPQLISENQY